MIVTSHMKYTVSIQEIGPFLPTLLALYLLVRKFVSLPES